MEDKITKEKIIDGLKITYTGTSSSVQNAQQYLSSISKKAGISMALVNVVNDEKLDLEMKKSALINLKNIIIEKRAHRRQRQISSFQLSALKMELFKKIERWDPKMMKQYKKIMSILWQMDQQNNTLVKAASEIVSLLKNGIISKGVLQALLTIADHFEFAISQHQRMGFSQVIKNIFPVLKRLVHDHPTPEIIYFSVKLLQKSTHFDLNPQKRKLIMEWMPLIYKILRQRNTVFEINFSETQAKYSDQFYYFHTKKWTMRILARFYSAHTADRAQQQDVQHFNNRWYKLYGFPLIDLIIQQLDTSTPRYLKILQFKALKSFANTNPQYFLKHRQNLVYDKLFPFMRLTPFQEQMTRTNPQEFIQKQFKAQYMGSIKQQAVYLWTICVQLDAIIRRMNRIYFNDPQYILQVIDYLEAKIEDNTNVIDKQMSMVLLDALKHSVKIRQISQRVTQFIRSRIMRELTSEFMIIRMRTFIACKTYCKAIQQDPELIKNIIQHMCSTLFDDPYVLVRIKAIEGLGRFIMEHFSIVKNIIRPKIKQIVLACLWCMKYYFYEQIAVSIDSIIGRFGAGLQCVGVQIIQEIHQSINNNNRFNLSQSQSNSDDELTTTQCLNTMSKVISKCLSNKAIDEIESIVGQHVIKLLLGSDPFIQEIFQLHANYIGKVPQVSQNMWMCFELLISYISGLQIAQHHSMCLKYLSQQKLVQFKEKNRGYLMTQILLYTVKVLVNYIWKGGNSQKQCTCVPYLVILMVTEINKHQQYAQQEKISISLYLLCHLIQSYQQRISQNQYQLCYHYLKQVLSQRPNKSIRKKCLQLCSLLIWLNVEKFIQLTQKDQKLNYFLQELLQSYNIYRQRGQLYAKSRILLGLSSFLKQINSSKKHNKNERLCELISLLLQAGVKIGIKIAEEKKSNKQNKNQRRHQQSVSSSSALENQSEDQLEQQQNGSQQVMQEDSQAMLPQSDHENNEIYQSHSRSLSDNDEDDDGDISDESEEEGEFNWSSKWASNRPHMAKFNQMTLFRDTIQSLWRNKSNEIQRLMRAVDNKDLQRLEQLYHQIN